MLFRWLRHWKNRFLNHRPGRPLANKRQRPRLSFDALEDRTLLSAGLGLLGPAVLGHATAAQAGRVDPRPERRTAPNHLRGVVSLNNTTLQLHFSVPLGKSAGSILSYQVPGLNILGVNVSKDRRMVTLFTSSQEGRLYTVLMKGLRTLKGARVQVARKAAVVMGTARPLPVQAPLPPGAPADLTPPRVVGAASTATGPSSSPSARR